MIIFDQISVPESEGLGISGAIIADNFTLSATTKLTAASFNLGESLFLGVDDGVFDGFSGTLSLGIYTVDQSGRPQQLIYQITDTDTTITDIGKFTSADLFRADVDIDNLILSAGEYAIGIMESQWLSTYDGTGIFYLTDLGSADTKSAYGISGGATPIYTKLFENMSFAISGDVLPDTVPPTGTDKVITFNEDTAYTFAPQTFGFSDGDGDTFSSVRIQTVPSVGQLALNGNLVGAGSEIAVADISKLTFTPTANANGAGYAKVSFQVMDDGAASIDPIPNWITFNVTSVNDVPTANDDSATVNEDTKTEIYVLANDVDPDQLTPSILQASDPLHGTLEKTANSITYTPDPNYFGTDNFTYTIIDAGGILDTATVTLTVVSLNDAPVAGDDTFAALKDSPLKMRASELLANDFDVDGQPIFIGSISNAQHGTAKLNPDGSVIFTPSPGYSGPAGFDYVLSDTALTKDTAHVTINVVEGDPVVTPSIQSLVTFRDVPVAVLVDASDPQDDPLSFSATAVQNGSITGGQNGGFVFTPDEGFTGAASFSVHVSDGQSTVTQIVHIAVTDKDVAPNWILLTETGFAGSIGGSGEIYGTNGFERITVLDEPGHVYLDASFNKGENVLRLAGDAENWRVLQSGSSAIFSDGDTFVHLPVGTKGIPIVFDDGVRTLVIDLQQATLKIGSQAFAETLVQIAAPADSTSLPSGAKASSSGLLLLQPGATVAAVGKLAIYGTSSNETVHLLSGNVTLDASFNKGRDILHLDLPASSFKVSQTGSTVFLDSIGTDIFIPVGNKGITLEFSGNDDRTLVIDMEAGAIFLGSQQIGIEPLSLTAFA